MTTDPKMMTPDGMIGDLKPIRTESGAHMFVRIIKWDDATRRMTVRVEDTTSRWNGKTIVMELIKDGGTVQ